MAEPRLFTLIRSGGESGQSFIGGILSNETTYTHSPIDKPNEIATKSYVDNALNQTIIQALQQSY